MRWCWLHLVSGGCTTKSQTNPSWGSRIWKTENEKHQQSRLMRRRPRRRSENRRREKGGRGRSDLKPTAWVRVGKTWFKHLSFRHTYAISFTKLHPLPFFPIAPLLCTSLSQLSLYSVNFNPNYLLHRWIKPSSPLPTSRAQHATSIRRWCLWIKNIWYTESYVGSIRWQTNQK